MKIKLLLSADLTDKMMKKANEGLQKQCMEKDEVALAYCLANLGVAVLNSGMVSILKELHCKGGEKKKSMKIPASGCQVYKRTHYSIVDVSCQRLAVLTSLC